MREFNGKRFYTRAEKLRCYADEKMYKKSLTIEKNKRIITRALLDSSLIFPTVQMVYTHKIVQCGDYYQIYEYPDKRLKNRKHIEKMKDKKRKQLNIEIDDVDLDLYDSYFCEDGLCSFRELMLGKYIPKPEIIYPKKEQVIELKNINRSKLELQRLVKTNEKDFKTFITLTFKDEISSIADANKKFDIWRTKVQSVLKKQKKELKYICVPEFQKKREEKFGIGVVHYHLLTNLDINNSDIIIPQKQFTENQLLKMSEKQRKNCFDVKYWKYGYSSVQSVKSLNVVGYISKYMTKYIDNRLWGKRRYLASHNLKKPCVVYYDNNDDNCFYKLLEINNTCDKKIETFFDDGIGQPIFFSEWRLKNV